MTQNTTLDFDAIRSTTDLQAVIVADLGPPARGRKWVCPYHDDQNPSLALTPDRRHWRCWSCGAAGDVFDWLQRREGIDLVEAARRLDPSAAPGSIDATKPRRQTAPPAREPERAPVWHDPAWQAAVEAIVTDAEAELWGAGGRAALDWLRARGLADHTIRRFRLGFVAEDGWGSSFVWPDGKPRGFYTPRGITMPWLAPGACYSPTQALDGPRWVGCNVRRLADDPFEPLQGGPKCQALSGSTRGYGYPWPDLLPTQGMPLALIVEGELDALLAEQEAGRLAYVVTVGGASQSPHRTALAALARCPWWLVALDHDDAGVEGARAWRERAPHKAHRVLLPHGKDIGEFVQAGGNLVDWLKAELCRVAARVAPLPADVAVPAGWPALAGRSAEPPDFE